MIFKKRPRYYKPKIKLYKSFKTTLYNKYYNKTHILHLNKYLENLNFGSVFNKSSKKPLNLFEISTYGFFFPNNFTLKKAYKDELIAKQKFCCFYNNLSLKHLKNYNKKIKTKTKKLVLSNCYDRNWFLKNFLEQRVDSVLYRCYFILNYKEADYLVKKNAIKINNMFITNSKSILKNGDILKINIIYHQFIKKNIYKSLKFEFLPKNFQINFKILKLIYLTKNSTCTYLFNIKNCYTQFSYNQNLINRYFQYN